MSAKDNETISLIQSLANSAIISREAQWRASGEGTAEDGSDNPMITQETNSVYLPMDNATSRLKEFYDHSREDTGDFIFDYDKCGNLMVSNVKWSKDGVELYDVCGTDLSSTQGTSKDGYPWYKVEDVDSTDCSTTQNITAYLLDDDTVKISASAVDNYKDKVLIATIKDSIINRIIQHTIMRETGSVLAARSWTVRQNGTAWEVFDPVWNVGSTAIYPEGMTDAALKWNAITSTCGKLYANLITKNTECSTSGGITVEHALILSNKENDLGSSECSSSTANVSSVTIGEFKADCNGIITGFCQYTDGAFAQSEPKATVANVITMLEITSEAAEGGSSSSSTATHLKGYTTPINVVAGKQCENPSFDFVIPGSVGGQSESWVPAVEITDITGAGSSSSSSSVIGKHIKICFTCNTDGSTVSDEGDIYNGPYFIPHLEIEPMTESSTVVGNKLTFSFTNSCDSSDVITFQPIEVKNGTGGTGESGQIYGYGPMTVAKDGDTYVLRQYLGTFDSEGNFKASGTYNDVKLTAVDAFTGMEYNNDGCYKATTKKMYTIKEENGTDVYVKAQRILGRIRLNACGLYQDSGYFRGAGFDDANFVSDMTGMVADVISSYKAVGGDDNGLYSLGGAVILKPVGSEDGSTRIIKKIECDVVTGANYTAPSACGELGKVSITYKSGAAFAAFVTTEAPTDKEQVLIYTAVADAQAADTYQNA